jgi:hypothetical protein
MQNDPKDNATTNDALKYLADRPGAIPMPLGIDQERDLYEELAFLFYHRSIDPKDFPALKKLMDELHEK